jgi:hypothetical protein
MDMDRVWVSFFNMCFEVSEHALKKGWITCVEIGDNEPYLYWGLTGATVLETVFRSENLTGHTLMANTCPSEHAALFQALLDIRSMVKPSSLMPS